MPDFYKKAHATQLLIAANVIVFLAESCFGGSENAGTALSFGALYTPYIIERGEWYRLFTSMFLHFGPEHLGSNMLSLLALGPYAEYMFGRIPFLLIYFVSGICGNLLTLYVELVTGNISVSAGASGAICGLMGVLIFLSLTKRFGSVFPKRNIALAFICMVLPGLTDSSINLYAHLGGAAGGMLMTALIYTIKKIRAGTMSGRRHLKQ